MQQEGQDCLGELTEPCPAFCALGMGANGVPLDLLRRREVAMQTLPDLYSGLGLTPCSYSSS